MRKAVIVFFLCLISGTAAAQIEAAMRDTSPILVINFLRYKRVFNYATVGPALNQDKLKSWDGNLGIDIHFHEDKKLYFIGIMRGKEFVKNNFFPRIYDRVYNELHAGLGFQKDRLRWMAGIYGGASFMLGEYVPGVGEASSPVTSPGLFASIKVIKRPIYDVGYGIELFGVYNAKYPIAGLRLILFFSDAYKGKQTYNTISK